MPRIHAELFQRRGNALRTAQDPGLCQGAAVFVAHAWQSGGAQLQTACGLRLNRTAADTDCPARPTYFRRAAG